MTVVYERLSKAYDSIKDRIPYSPKVGLILGSGLGDFADEVKQDAVIPYNEIEGFPVSTAPGHKGQFIFCEINGVKTVCMQGRVHYYEGYSMDEVVLPTRLMRMMGAEILFVTNACGGINYSFNAGDLMMITDHITLFVPSPLIGPNESKLGVRFPDMSDIYDKKYRDVVRAAARRLNMDLKEGVYCQLTGPQYESPSEIRAIRNLGADVVGMSTAVEALAANHMGMGVIGISLISNLAAGISPTPLSEQEVLDAGRDAAPKFKKLVSEVIKDLE